MADVLVVDNNEHISKMFKEVLAQNGHKVTTALNGHAALKIIENNVFEIAFIDLGLPDICGLEIIKSLKMKSPLTVTIVISGKNNINYAIESIKSGVFRYLKKPFDLDDIKEITNLAHQERMHMVETGYSPNKKLPHHRKDRKRNSIKFLVDLSVATAALLLGFIIQQEIYQWLEIPSVWGYSEILNLTLSFVCCYSLIYLKFRPSTPLSNIKVQPGKDFMNFTSVYILYAAILFFVTDMVDSRLALIGGYCLGLGGLRLTRFTLVPFIERVFSRKQEGTRRIILKGFNKLADDKPVNARLKPDSIPDKAASEPSKDLASSLIREFKGDRAISDSTAKDKQPGKVIHQY